MKAGRELDALVAEKVMGWMDGDGVGLRVADGEVINSMDCRPWSPSTDIAAAWEVVEKMAARMRSDSRFNWSGPHFKSPHTYLTSLPEVVYPLGTECWYVETSSGVREWSCAATAEHAICLAALKAVGG